MYTIIASSSRGLNMKYPCRIIFKFMRWADFFFKSDNQLRVCYFNKVCFPAWLEHCSLVYPSPDDQILNTAWVLSCFIGISLPLCRSPFKSVKSVEESFDIENSFLKATFSSCKGTLQVSWNWFHNCMNWTVASYWISCISAGFCWFNINCFFLLFCYTYWCWIKFKAIIFL